jgi:hypothetical protein
MIKQVGPWDPTCGSGAGGEKPVRFMKISGLIMGILGLLYVFAKSVRSTNEICDRDILTRTRFPIGTHHITFILQCNLSDYIPI